MSDAAVPFLKYAGGKRQLLPSLIDAIPETDFGAYYEPMVGGGAFFFEMFNRGWIGKARIGDINRELVTTYCAIRDNVERVIEKLREYENEASMFYAVREQRPFDDADMQDKASIAARMIFLNRTAFNGMYRVNRHGQFNVPFGNYKNPTICDEARLRAAADALQGIRITCENFDEVVAYADENDFVYFDPPYIPISPTANFVGYTAGGFGMEDHEHLALVFEELIERGVYCLLSNADVPWVHDRFAEFEIVCVKAKRAINSDGTKRGPVREVIVIGDPRA